MKEDTKSTDRVLQVQRVYTTGGQCLQYRVQIGKKTRLLFCELDTTQTL